MNLNPKITRANLKRWLPWIARVVVVAHVVLWIAPAYPRAVMGTPKTVETEHSLVCVHTRLTDEIEPWKIQRVLELVREMGATAIVEYFPWAYVEDSKGSFDWWHADQVINHAANQGLKVYARLGMVPDWARPDADEIPTSTNYLGEPYYQDFADFAAVFAARYTDKLAGLIIWNEPNLSFEWGYRPVDPAEYTDLLRVTYPAIKAAAPDVPVLAGALAPTLEPVGSPHGMNDLIYLGEMYQTGAADYFDALAVHTYGFKFPPSAEPGEDILNFRRAEYIRALMVEYGDGDKPVYITEAGWNDHPRWTKAVRPGQRIAYTLEAFQFVEDEWDWVDQLCIWAFKYPERQGNWRDYFTFVTPDFQIKPIYEAVQDYARGWGEWEVP
jgi:hypothetical protein